MSLSGSLYKCNYYYYYFDIDKHISHLVIDTVDCVSLLATSHNLAVDNINRRPRAYVYGYHYQQHVALSLRRICFDDMTA